MTTVNQEMVERSTLHCNDVKHHNRAENGERTAVFIEQRCISSLQRLSNEAVVSASFKLRTKVPKGIQLVHRTDREEDFFDFFSKLIEMEPDDFI